MSNPVNDNQIKLLHQRIYAAISVTRDGSGSRLLCEPFNPGPAEKVDRLAVTVLGKVLMHLLASAPPSVVEQLVDDIDSAVVSQGTFNTGRDRRAMLQHATFGKLERAAADCPKHEAAQPNTTENADQ